MNCWFREDIRHLALTKQLMTHFFFEVLELSRLRLTGLRGVLYATLTAFVVNFAVTFA